jgi:hypothetical protein
MMHILQVFSDVYSKHLFKMFHMFQTYMLQQVFYLDVAYVSHMLQVVYLDVHIFHTHIVSVLSRRCIYFTHMLQ